MKVLLEINESEFYTAKNWQEYHDALVEILRDYREIRRYNAPSDDWFYAVGELLETLETVRKEGIV